MNDIVHALSMENLRNRVDERLAKNGSKSLKKLISG